MYRMNAQSRAIEESFLRYGIRYQLVGGTRFYARREVKDALAYLRILRSDTDSVSFERIINVPARGIGDKTIEVLRAAAAREDGTTWGAIEAAANGDARGPRPADPRTRSPSSPSLVRRLRTRIGVLALPELLDEALEASGYRAMLADGSEDGEERWANLLELRLGHDPLRRPRPGRRARPAARGDRARRRPGLVRGRRRRGDADHAPRGQGPRVPGRLHRRPRGGPVPAQPGARRREGARGGAPPRVRRHHPREAAAVPLARLATRDLGDGPGRRPVAVPARDPGRADGRAAARRRRRPRPGPGPRLRGAADEPVQHADPRGPAAAARSARAAAGPARPRPASRSARAATSPRSATRSPPARHSGSLSRPVRAWDDDLDSGSAAATRSAAPARRAP